MFRVFCLLACVTLAGCGGGVPETQNGLRPRQVRMDWLGHESFLFRSSLGTKILTNPYAPESTGRSFPSGLRPDILLISSEQPDANNVNAVDNAPAIFRGAVGVGPNNASGLRIRGVATYQNPDQEAVTAMNLLFSWTLDGVRFCFAGNILNPLTASQLSQVGTVDVLILPVGVPSGLTDGTRQTIISQLRPRVIVPMGREADFSAWAAGFPKVHRLPGSSVLLSSEALPAEQTVLILTAP